MRTIKVGLDIGNSAVKGSILSETNGVLKNILMPSAINTIHDEKLLHFANRSVRYMSILDSPLEHSKAILAIGDVAMDIPDYQEYDVSATSYKTNHLITTALLLGIIGEAVNRNEDEIDVLLAVSIPIVESKTFDLIKNYRALLKGRHMIRIYEESGHRDIAINIKVAQVLNEGQSGFLGLLDTIDTTFRTTMDALFESLDESTNAIDTLEDFLVVDIGEGTTDLAVFRGKKFNPEFSYSITKGYGNLLEQAMAKAEREGITIESRKALQSLLSSTNPRRKAQRDLWAAYVDVERRDYVHEVVQTVLKVYARQSYLDAIIFLGGGFSALTGYGLAPEGNVTMTDRYLFDHLATTLEKNNKVADLVFGIPQPYSQSINNRGLMQVLSMQSIKR